MSLFDDETYEPANLLPKDGEVFYHPGFIPKPYPDVILKDLINLCQEDWRQDKIHIQGKDILIPRLQAWYGDDGKTFTYSGIHLTPKPWISLLSSLNEKVSKKCGIVFTSVLVNLYRNGQDSVAWHQDDEPGLGKNPVIASLSFGAQRSFQLRHLEDRTLTRNLKLESGSLLIMRGETQHKWQHCVPKDEKEENPRINLTFRVIKPIDDGEYRPGGIR